VSYEEVVDCIKVILRMKFGDLVGVEATSKYEMCRPHQCVVVLKDGCGHAVNARTFLERLPGYTSRRVVHDAIHSGEIRK